ncbi:dUTP diphosphatase [Psychrobacillus sp. NPDC096389]|uniref:dUTP diphosphatase n=1 Tax=Psychrobacillus sp. NPDC096389 TaxID=3364490 RepID=UPI0037FA192F
MNLAKLFETQRVLDERIMEKHPELRGQENLDWKILALQVELGECANEWRGFKRWSNDQESRTSVRCPRCSGEGTYAAHYIGGYNQVDCSFCNATGSVRNPLLEEYVDCLHFILSIGLELNIQNHYADEVNFNIGSRTKKTYPIKEFKNMFMKIAIFVALPLEKEYTNLLSAFTTLGDSLGFAEEQIENAYFEKNAVNHERQANGY